MGKHGKITGYHREITRNSGKSQEITGNHREGGGPGGPFETVSSHFLLFEHLIISTYISCHDYHDLITPFLHRGDLLQVLRLPRLPSFSSEILPFLQPKPKDDS